MLFDDVMTFENFKNIQLNKKAAQRAAFLFN